MVENFEYVFPSIKGIQAGREYYVSMCPIGLIPKIFLFDEEELRPELRAQRTINRTRIPEIAHYILDNEDSYVFSAITASIDSEVRFQVIPESDMGSNIGRLHVPMTAKFIINDGQHRRAAIEIALNERPELADETIAVVFFLDVGLERCQQMFADLNRYAIRPSKSLGILYDHRDRLAILTKKAIFNIRAFRGLVEMERNSLSLRSRKLFTLNSVYSANKALLRTTIEDHSDDEILEIIESFWEEVEKNMLEWKSVRDREMNASQLRQDSINSHGITLQALGEVGNYLIRHKIDFAPKLAKLKKIDWARSNAQLWEGRALVNGRVSKAGTNVMLTTNIIKKFLRIELTPDEQRIENAFLSSQFGGNSIKEEYTA
jgi:DNA sulfur modification protein DndB